MQLQNKNHMFITIFASICVILLTTESILASPANELDGSNVPVDYLGEPDDEISAFDRFSRSPVDVPSIVRFGKQEPGTRFGKRAPIDRSAMVRFGKRAPMDRSSMVRFGKRAPMDRSAMVRFGKRAPIDRSAMVRFGKRSLYLLQD